MPHDKKEKRKMKKTLKKINEKLDSFIEWNPFFAFVIMFSTPWLLYIVGMMCVPETWDPYYQIQQSFIRFKSETSYEAIVNNIVDQYTDNFEFVFLEEKGIEIKNLSEGLATKTEKGWIIISPEIILEDIENAEILRKGAATMIIIQNPDKVVALAE